MEVQGNAGRLVGAIAAQEISVVVDRLTDKFRLQATGIMHQFVQYEPSPSGSDKLVNSLFDCLRSLGRELVQWLFGSWVHAADLS